MSGETILSGLSESILSSINTFINSSGLTAACNADITTITDYDTNKAAYLVLSDDDKDSLFKLVKPIRPLFGKRLRDSFDEV